MGSTHLDASIKIAAEELGGDEIHDLLVEADLDQPDMAAIVLSNSERIRWSERVKLGDDIEVKLGFAGGQKPATVFKGEVTGLEPIFASGQPQRVVVRALNALHRLARGKKSVSWAGEQTDKQIVEKICRDYSLSAKFGDAPPTMKNKHVYQHNQTDLEFLRWRASRIGYEIRVEDKELHFCRRSDKDSGISLDLGVQGDNMLEKFLPRLSTANQVSEVRVHAWDPEKKEEIQGSAKPQSSKLGDTHGTRVAEETHKNILAIDVDAPVSSKEEADAIARSILQERMMSFITGEGVCKGNPEMKPGIIVSINVQDKRFSGKYYITAVRHRYVHAGPTGGYRTEFRFKRDAESTPDRSGPAEDTPGRTSPAANPTPPPTTQGAGAPAADAPETAAPAAASQSPAPAPQSPAAEAPAGDAGAGAASSAKSSAAEAKAAADSAREVKSSTQASIDSAGNVDVTQSVSGSYEKGPVKLDGDVKLSKDGVFTDAKLGAAGDAAAARDKAEATRNQAESSRDRAENARGEAAGAADRAAEDAKSDASSTANDKAKDKL